MKKHSLLFDSLDIRCFFGKLTLALILVLSLFGYTSAQGSNSTPLDVSNLSFTPSTIDTTDSSQTVSVTVRATDVVNDVNRVIVRFRSLTGNQFAFATLSGQNRISGDGRDGVYQGGVIFPQNSKAGMWLIFEINAFDSLNYKNFYSSDISQRGFPTELQVISVNEDVKPPEIMDFSFTPSAIDTTNGSQNVVVTVRAADAQAGVRFLSVGFQIPNDDILYGVSMKRISGDEKDGVYQGNITFSERDASGTYEVSVDTTDALGNANMLGKTALTERGFAAELQIFNASQTPQPIQKSRKRTRILQL